MANEIKFLFNGIKIEGKLVKGSYLKGRYNNNAIGCFYVKEYFSGQNELLRKYFKVENDTNTMTDYFDDDIIYFFENSKYEEDFEKMVQINKIRSAKRTIKRYEKTKSKRPNYFKKYYQEDYEKLLKEIS